MVLQREKDYLPSATRYSGWDLGKKIHQDGEQRNRVRNGSPPQAPYTNRGMTGRTPVLEGPSLPGTGTQDVVIEMGVAAPTREYPKRSKNTDFVTKIEEILRGWTGSGLMLTAAVLAAIVFVILMILLILIQH